MRYAEVIGRSDGHVSFAMRCSACGVGLHGFAAHIDACRMRYCPKCGHFLQRRSPLVRNGDIVRMLNNQHTVLVEAPRNCDVLSAPPRNCDRYATWDKGWDAFSKSYFGPTDPGELEYHFGVWLFAKEETRP